jgi:hypothetical protein
LAASASIAAATAGSRGAASLACSTSRGTASAGRPRQTSMRPRRCSAGAR